MELIEEQLSRVDQPVHALLLVGGFAGSEYLKERVHVRHSFAKKVFSVDFIYAIIESI